VTERADDSSATTAADQAAAEIERWLDHAGDRSDQIAGYAGGPGVSKSGLRAVLADRARLTEENARYADEFSRFDHAWRQLEAKTVLLENERNDWRNAAYAEARRAREVEAERDAGILEYLRTHPERAAELVRVEMGRLAVPNSPRRLAWTADRSVECVRCTEPVLVYTDGSTAGGVDTLDGILCDRCLAAHNGSAKAARAERRG
jgi:hypothetical protein